jgi:hypothetical protein
MYLKYFHSSIGDVEKKPLNLRVNVKLTLVKLLPVKLSRPLTWIYPCIFVFGSRNRSLPQHFFAQGVDDALTNR